jgi:hypothetical protein
MKKSELRRMIQEELAITEGVSFKYKNWEEIMTERDYDKLYNVLWKLGQ